MLILKMVVEPLTAIILILLAGALLRRRHKRLGLTLISTAFLLLYVLSTPLAGAYLLRSLELEGVPGDEAGQTPPRAIVVLGAGVRTRSPEFGGDTVGRLTLERIRYGARLYRKTGLPVLVTGGTYRKDVTPVSVTMAKALAEDFGVSVRWVEDKSRNTYENAKLSATILRREDINSIYLVTHAWHMARAAEAFTYVGLEVVPAPTGMKAVGSGVAFQDFVPNSRALADSAYAIHEGVGRLWYWIVYY